MTQLHIGTFAGRVRAKVGPSAHILPDGTRLHLQHGPIDLVIGADGDRQGAFEAAYARFQTVLDRLVRELPALKAPLRTSTRAPCGPVAGRMHAAVMPFAESGYLTRMAAVAGAVADEVLAAMLAGASEVRRAYVNNGGDIAIWLEDGASFRVAMQDGRGASFGDVILTRADKVGGIATSGRHGRSHSLGIADSVTVLARSAAEADVAATLIANAVDLPGHPGITRCAARELDEESDLRDQQIVMGCARLSPADCAAALARGQARAKAMVRAGQIRSAALFLQGQSVTTTTDGAIRTVPHEGRELDHVRTGVAQNRVFA